jgi:hypothetical protein
MADHRSKDAEQVLARPAGMTILADEQDRSQRALGQGARGSVHDQQLPVFKVFHRTLNVPTGDEQVSIGAGGIPQGVRPNFKPVPGAINVPHGEEQVTISR